MRTKLPDARVQPRFAGVCTFCRFPLLQTLPPDARPVDWAVYGYPFDAGVTFRSGARFGPRAVRDASQYVKPYHIEHDVNICERLSLADAGDAPVKPYSVKETLDAAVDWACQLGDTGVTRLLAVGGDHSLLYANMKATWLRAGSPPGGLPLVHFDAHLDTVDVTGGSKWTHASPIIRLIEEGVLDPRRTLSIGIRGPLNAKSDLTYARDQGIRLLTFAQWQQEGSARIAAFVRELADAPAYVTFDVDVLDPAFAPGTGTPCPGGFTSAEALSLLRQLKGLNLIGADVVEVLPDRDASDITSFFAAHVILELLALAALRAHA